MGEQDNFKDASISPKWLARIGGRTEEFLHTFLCMHQNHTSIQTPKKTFKKTSVILESFIHGRSSFYIPKEHGGKLSGPSWQRTIFSNLLKTY